MLVLCALTACGETAKNKHESDTNDTGASNGPGASSTDLQGQNSTTSQGAQPNNSSLAAGPAKPHSTT